MVQDIFPTSDTSFRLQSRGIREEQKKSLKVAQMRWWDSGLEEESGSGNEHGRTEDGFMIESRKGLVLPKLSAGETSEKGYRTFKGSVQFIHSVVSNSLRPHESQHAGPPCLSPTPGACSNSCLSSRWCHPTISSSVLPFSSSPQSFPALGSFPRGQCFILGGQSIGVSAVCDCLSLGFSFRIFKHLQV